MKTYFFRSLARIVLALLFFVPEAGAQIKASRINSDDPAGVPYRIRKAEWTEIISERKLHSSVFKKPDGTWVTYASTALVNYPNEQGILVPVSTELKRTADGWSVPAQPIPYSLDKSGKVRIEMKDGQAISYSGNVSINGQKLSSGQPRIMGDTALFHSQLPGIDKFIQFRVNASKYSYIIRQQSAVPSGDLIVKEDVELPLGCVLVRDTEMSEMRGDRIAGHLIAKNERGEEMLRFGSVFCYDESGAWVLGEYRFVQKGNKVEMEMIVPAAWMHDPSRTFPIVIDPLVVGPTTTYPNVYIPSCLFPAYGKDSIEITVPAAITVNNLSVSGSYYADPFTTTTMADGDMFFSTSCNNSTTFTIAPPGGNTPGTAYLEDYNLKSPLMCCRPQTCTSYTFYLTMHITRQVNGTGCNTTYLYYNPFTGFPFSAYIEGNTVESYTSNYYLNPATLCANTCETQTTVYARYGVPPFVFSHPWSSSTVTSGTPAGCSPANEIEQLQLDIPNCPNYCDTATSLTVPFPSVVDACGNSVSGWPTKFLTIKPVAQVSANPDSLVICSGMDASIALTACLPGATINWFGNGLSGTGDILDTLVSNSDSTLLQLYYSSFVTMNGCTSDTLQIPLTVEPQPQLDFSTNPSPVFITQLTTFNELSSTPGSVVNYFWNLGDGTTSLLQNPDHIYTTPGDYVVCFGLNTTNNCADTICKTITVLPLTIVPPNVITPNNDGLNDALVFPYLEFYNGNSLTILNRWGQVIYEKENYANDWKGDGHPDGVYYYVLIAGDQDYSGFFHISTLKK